MPPRLGTHVSSAGGLHLAVERAHELGCDTMQVFTSSPRQWRATAPRAADVAEMQQLRRRYKIRPLVVHANYLINVAADDGAIRRNSIAALRGELERARDIGAEYLVLHPGSGELEPAVAGIREAAEAFRWDGLTLLIENMAGGGKHLAGSFASVGAMLDGLGDVPTAACIDVCHAWAMGYDLVSESGYKETMRELDQTVGLKRVPVFHANDAKTERGSHHDRHEHIGKGKLGEGVFRRLLTDRRLRSRRTSWSRRRKGNPPTSRHCGG